MTKRIKLTKGMSTIVDDDDFESVNQYKWYFSSTGYAERRHGKGKLLLHRFIMNPKNDLQVDHINGNRLDNSRSNLRLATRTENARNRKMQKKQ